MFDPYLRSTNRDPDNGTVVIFKNHAVHNPAKSAIEGRPIHDDQEVAEVRFPGQRDMRVVPAVAHAEWITDPETGGLVSLTYAERYARQYRQFKENQVQTKSGTPLAYAPFLTEARRAELRALNILTVEMLAELDGQPLKNLGIGGRDLKNKAEEYIAESKQKAPDIQLANEVEALRLKNEVLETDLKMLREKAQNSEKADAMFDEMTTDQIKDFIATNTGHVPQGALNRKTLVRMASEARSP